MSSELKARIAGLSPEQRATLLASLEKKRSMASEMVGRKDPDRPVMLSLAQEQLWFLDQLTPGSTPYAVPFYLRLRGPLDVGALQASLDAIVDRHQVLRTRFSTPDGQPKPVLMTEWSAACKQLDLRALPASRREEEVRRLLQEEASRPFDFTRDVMLRTMLLRVADEEHVLFHNSHHIAWDLGSKAVFYRELAAFYTAYRLGRKAELPDLPIQYSDYAVWQRDWLQGSRLEALSNYWRDELEGAPTRLELPTVYPRPRVRSLRGRKIACTLPADTLEGARSLSARSGVTLYMTMLAAFGAFLHRWTGQADILIGSPVDGRERPETRDLIGFFINTVVMRLRLHGDMTFRELLRATRDTTLGAVEHSQLPFHKVVEIVAPRRDMSRPPLFQVNFRLQPGPPTELHLDGLAVEGPYLIDNGAAKFDLSLELPSVERGPGFLEYCTDLFDEDAAHSVQAGFQELLGELLAKPDDALTRHEIRLTSKRIQPN